LNNVSPGFDPAGVLSVRVAAPASRYAGDTQVAEFYTRLLDALRRIPGVEQAGGATSLPLGGWLFGTRFIVDGVPQDPERPPSAHIQHTTPGYFEALRIELAGGRTFAATDTASARLVVVVNETFVRRFVPDGRALGRRMWVDGSTAGPAAEIVGIVRDVKTGGLGDAALATPEIYVPHAQAPAPVMQLALRTSFDEPRRIVPDLRAAVRSVDSELPIGAPIPMDERIGLSLRTQRFRTAMFGAFAALAALLACLGVYAVRSRAVALRTREFGIRLALGASRRQVLAQTLRQGMTLTAFGVAIGLTAALLAARGIETWLFETRATDPLTIAAAAALLGVAALVASYVPAQRAATADPLIALRDQ
jgi:putative ABC transport system permease protein